jgi:hypothetical protein
MVAWLPLGRGDSKGVKPENHMKVLNFRGCSLGVLSFPSSVNISSASKFASTSTRPTLVSWGQLIHAKLLCRVAIEGYIAGPRPFSFICKIRHFWDKNLKRPAVVLDVEQLDSDTSDNVGIAIQEKHEQSSGKE